MDSPEDAVFFKATPHNIAAFLAAHRWADMTAIGTVDEKTFLTARMGMIDIRPDQEYLASKIIPAYAPCLMDPDKTMELETVPREVAQSPPVLNPTGTICGGTGTAMKSIKQFKVEMVC